MWDLHLLETLSHSFWNIDLTSTVSLRFLYFDNVPYHTYFMYHRAEILLKEHYCKMHLNTIIRNNIGTRLYGNKVLQNQFARPVELPRDRPADFTTSGGLYKECNDTEGQFGIEIAGLCFRPDVLCSGDLEQNNYRAWGDGTLHKNTTLIDGSQLRFHPQHISICKNLTFWNSIWESQVRM